jgi:hypothetical protein
MKTWIIFFTILALALPAAAQRAIKKSESVEQYRPLGEMRVWTFEAKDSTVGNLVSTVKARTEVDGTEGVEIDEVLKLDYNKIGSPLTMDITNQRTVAESGSYLGDDMKLNISDQNEQLFLQRSGDEIVGYSTRGGEKIQQKVAYPEQRFAVESNFMDQYEMFLAMRDIKVGDTLVDSVFSPQSLSYTRIKGNVVAFLNLRVYNEIFDSAFAIHLSEPQEKLLYFTPDKRLIKAVIPAQDIKIYLDVVKPAAQAPPPYKPVRSIGLLVEAYLIYIFIGALSALLFIGGEFKNPLSYIVLVVGGILYFLMIFTQIPLQLIIVRKLFTPKVIAGASPLFWGIFPALVVGIVQELVKAGGMFGLVKFGAFKRNRAIVFGAMFGVGFGIIEASYLAAGVNSTQLFGIGVLERAFTILFQTASGALIGYALATGVRKLSFILPITILLNSLFRYLPVLVQAKLSTPELLQIVLAFVSVSFVLVVLILFKRNRTV